MTPLERLFTLRREAATATSKAEGFHASLDSQLGPMRVYVNPDGNMVLRKYGVEVELEPDQAQWAAKHLGAFFDHDRWDE